VAEDKTKFELVSPEELLLSEEVDMVVVPGGDGDFGAMARHAPLISSVRPGVIQVHDGGSVKNRIFVAGGFAEVTPERCTVLAEVAVPVEKIDRSQTEQDLKDAREDVEDAKEEREREAAERRVKVLEAKLAAAALA
jgi:F-type H+-transporting ATPase subunit epsilon